MPGSTKLKKVQYLERLTSIRSWQMKERFVDAYFYFGLETKPYADYLGDLRISYSHPTP